MIAKKTFYFFVMLLLICNSEVAAQQLKLGLPLGHTKQVTSAAISPDGKNVITVSADGTAKLWEAGSGKSRLVTEFIHLASHQLDFIIAKTTSPCLLGCDKQTNTNTI